MKTPNALLIANLVEHGIIPEDIRFSASQEIRRLNDLCELYSDRIRMMTVYINKVRKAKGESPVWIVGDK